MLAANLKLIVEQVTFKSLEKSPVTFMVHDQALKENNKTIN